MAKVNRLLVLIDFSVDASGLIQLAGKLSEKIKAELVFVHQVAGRVPSLADAESRRQIIEIEKDEALAKIKERVINQLSNESIRFVVSEKGMLQLLSELRSHVYKDWVLVGLKRSGMWRKIFIESTTSKIVDQTDLLTLAMPLQGTVFVPDQLVVATSYKYPINQKEFSDLLLHFEGLIQKIQFISVVTENDDSRKAKEYLENLKEIYLATGCSISLFEGQDVFDEIKRFMKDQSGAYLVLQQGSRTLTDNFFRRFMINDLVHSGEVPLIILPS